MNQPWYFVGFGALVGAVGAFFAVLGFSDPHTPALIFGGFIVGGLGGMALFVGLIALAVEIGVRGADR